MKTIKFYEAEVYKCERVYEPCVEKGNDKSKQMRESVRMTFAHSRNLG